MAITAKFEADFSQFKSAVQSAEETLKTFAGNTTSLGTAIATSLASAEIRRFAGDVTDVAGEFIDAYAEEEAAVKRLGTALVAQGNATPAVLKQYADLSTQLQNTTTFSDDMVTSVEAMLVQVGDVLPAQMPAALEAIANLAAGMGPQVGGLQGAALLVAKAFSSDGDALGKLKVILGDSIKPGADMAEVLAAINAKFGGQAAAQLETYAGRMAQLNNRMSDFKEKVGGVVVEGLTPLLNAFAALPQPVQTVSIGIAAVGAALAPLALSFAAVSAVITPLIPLIGTALTGALAVVAPYLGPAGIIAAGIGAWFVVFKNLDVFVWAAVASWNALKAAFAGAVDAITGSAQAIYQGLKTWLVDRFSGVMATVKGYIDTIMSWWRSLQATVGSALSFAAPAAGGVVGAIPSFAGGSGGFRDFGTGTLAMLHGTEAVVPAGSGGAAGMEINIYITQPLGTPEAIGRVISDHLTQAILQGRKVAA